MKKQMTSKFLITIICLLFCFAAVFPTLLAISHKNKVFAATTLGDIIELSEEKTESEYDDGTYYLKAYSITATTKPEPPVENAKFLYAIDKDGTTNADWYKQEGVIWEEGNSINFEPLNKEKISFSFIVIQQKEGTTLPENPKYSDLVGSTLSAAYSNVAGYDNINILVPSNKTNIVPYIKYTDETGTAKEKLIPNFPSRLYVPLKLFFKVAKFDGDENYSGEIKNIKINGEIIADDKWKDGYEINPLEYQAVTRLNITVTDKAKNEQSFFVSTGYVPKEQTEYTDEFKPESGTIANFFKYQSTEYFANETSLTAINARLEEYKHEYEVLGGEVDLFKDTFNGLQSPSLLYTLQGEDFVNTVNQMAEAIVGCNNLYDGLLVKGQKQAAVKEQLDLEKYTVEYNTARLSSKNIIITLKDLDSYTKDLNFYSCYIEETFEVIDRNIPNELSSALKTDLKLSEKYSFKIMRNNQDVTQEYIGKKVDIQILISNNFNPNKQIYPAGSIFQEGNFTTPTHNVTNGYTIFKDITIHEDTSIYISLKAGLNPWIIVGIVLGSLLLIGGGIFAVLIIYKRKSKNPEEKIKHLQDEVQKKMRMQDIAKKAKQEEEEVNRKHQEEIEKERLEAIEKVKAERKKKLMEKGDTLVQEAQKQAEELQKQELLEYERMAQEKMKEAQLQSQKQTKKTKKSSTAKTTKAKKTTTKNVESTDTAQSKTSKTTLKSRERKQKAQQIKSKKK